MGKLNINLHNSFKEQKDKLKNYLISYIKSHWINVDIDEDGDDDYNYLFHVVYEHGGDEDNYDSINFWVCSKAEDELIFQLKATYTGFDESFGCKEINNLNDFNNAINLLINNVKKGKNVKMYEEERKELMYNWSVKIYDEFYPTKSLSKEYLNLN